jgi:probable HAF family extracellular repeat protein
VANIAGNINNRGEVAGTYSLPDGTIRAFKWTRQTGAQDYGAFDGAAATIPGCCHTLNDRGEIVGFAIMPDGDMRAIIWQGREPKDLNNPDFIRDAGPFVQLLGATSINDAGDIVGFGLTQAFEVHAFLATPNHGAGARERLLSSAPGTIGPVVPAHVRHMLRDRYGIRGR